MSTLILDRRNIQLEYDNQCLVIRQPDNPPRTVPLMHLQKVICQHNVQLTTSLLGQLWKRGIDFITLNGRHTERQRRPPKDPVNSLLSLTSSLVLQEAIRQCTVAGLDPDLGFYHRIASGRPSLACDLMEPLRPFFEHWVMHLFIDGHFDSRHFTGQNSAQVPCYLGKAGRQAFYPLFYQASIAWQRQLKATTRWICQHLDSRLDTTLDPSA